MKHCTFLLVLAATLIAASLQAQGPNLINYQGRVMVGTVNFDGSGQFKFALVNAAGTTTYWSNDGTSVNGNEPSGAVALPVIKGLYSVLLGDTSLGAAMTALPASAFVQADLRLRVWFNDGVNGSQLLAPDQRLAPSAYLAAGSVTTATIADAAISGPKIAPGAVSGTQVAPNTLDASRFAVVGPPSAGQVLGFNGTGLTWTAPGGGVFSLNGTSAYYNGGNVGIGTNSPAVRLELRTVTGSYGFLHSDGTIKVGSYIGGSTSGATGGWLGTQSNHPLFFFVNNGQPAMTVSTLGSVGVGTSTPSAKLHVYEPSNSATSLIETGGGTNAWTQQRFKNADGTWIVGTSQNFNNDQFYIARLGLPNSFYIDSGGFYGGFTLADFYLGHASRRGAPGRALVDNGTSLVVNFGNDWGTTVIGGAVTQVNTLMITGGADLAEPFSMKEEELEKGSVVVIDDEHPGWLKQSGDAYDKRVAGIISGANGVNPGIALHQEGVLEGGKNVALSGRVYVRADASSGPIKPGDLLTTSAQRGRAMRVNDPTRAQGAVIGKAMSALPEGEGMVLVLVTLQ